MNRKFLTVLLVLFASHAASVLAQSSEPPTGAGIWETMRPIVPQHYVCRETSEPITIDGQTKETAWQKASWTNDFADIEGARRPKPRYRTRVKLLWDKSYLYVLAELEEPHVCGSITRQNQVIFHDNDFEVFIDPNADNHNYYEFEMNALNTTWELSLVKPYLDGGPVCDPDMLDGLKTAVHVRGTLDDPRDNDEGWSVEIAFPWKELARFADGTACPPQEGDIWRMGFSRVEWIFDIIDGKYRKVPGEMRREDNWVWSPQGIINMHRPERWGRVEFTSKSAAAQTATPDETAAARELLMEIYHRQKAFFAKHNRYAATPAELCMATEHLPQGVVGPVEMTVGEKEFDASVGVPQGDGNAKRLHVREDSQLNFTPDAR